METRNPLNTLFRRLFWKKKLKESFKIEQTNVKAGKELKTVGKNVK